MNDREYIKFLNKALDVCEDEKSKNFLLGVGLLALREHLVERHEFHPCYVTRNLSKDLLDRFPEESLYRNGGVL